MAAESHLFKIGITQGDINSISYEVIMKALADNKILELCTPIVYGISKIASFHKKNSEVGDFSFQFIKSIDQLSLKKANLINLVDKEIKLDLGKSTPLAGEMAELSLNTACQALKDKTIDAIVTAPINKDNIQSKTFRYSGHTEFFTHQFGCQNSLMMMVADNIKVAFATNHIPINNIAQKLTTELIINKLQILNHSLIYDFACTNPKIAVLALNPHAGDNQLIGKEEKEIIKPAINQAFEKNINAIGPFPADGFFASGNYKKFDAVLAMYHDQGMTPFKILSMNQGVNFTAGLPIVRTSPAHGTAYDLAGKNLADPQSFRNAIYLAIDILRNRENII